MKLFLTTLVTTLFLTGCFGAVTTSTLSCTITEQEADGLESNSTMDIDFESETPSFLRMESVIQMASEEEAETLHSIGSMMGEEIDYVTYDFSVDGANFTIIIEADIAGMMEAEGTDPSITFEDELDFTLTRTELKNQLEEEGWQCR